MDINGFRVLFHGCGTSIDCFTTDRLGQGAEDNSALGVHLAEFPGIAAAFAETAAAHREGEGMVLIVLAPASTPYVIQSFDDFFGLDENGDPVLGKEGFAELRTRLVAQGYDMVDYEDGEMGAICVSLLPEGLRVIGAMSIEQAYEFDDTLQQLEDPFDTNIRLSLLEDMIKTKVAPSRSPRL